jgi:hypothetical protein
MVGPNYYVPKAHVELRAEQNSGALQSQEADSNGRFFLVNVKKGKYWLYVRLPESDIAKAFPVVLTRDIKETAPRICSQEIEVSVCGIECGFNWLKVRKKAS